MRVALVHEAARLVTEDEVPGLEEAALSAELLQTHALVLDDIIDDSPVRRGGPSTYHACRDDFPGRPQTALGLAMMAGDLAGFLALRVLLRADIPDHRRLAMLDVQFAMTTDTVLGQVLDLERDVAPAPDEELLDAVSEYKTSRQAVFAPMALGLLAAGEDVAAREATLRRYARLAGIGGQMRDDWLDLFGEPDITGKPSRGDIRAGRHTYTVRALLAATTTPWSRTRSATRTARGRPSTASATSPYATEFTPDWRPPSAPPPKPRHGALTGVTTP
ncbi:polyprenyl synthetase family protein [Streptomyces yokosukanensis]|uniref:polyprenyl synthetase family protein n=1 Tax=Streptomyces yokosukanensis TaxID=67386 RepID=UPI000A679AA8